MSENHSIDTSDIAQFEQLGARWWDEHGPMRPLHQLNPVRISFIREVLAELQPPPAATQSTKPLRNLRLLDVGCGGGLLCEPLARLGADITGLDAAPGAIAAAKAHAAESGLAITYQTGTVEALAETGALYDCVLALEIIEHVTDPAAFIMNASKLVRPGGKLIVSTLNRTAKAYLLAIVGAEYVLGWLPRGTHRFEKFITPQELARFARDSGCTHPRTKGMVYSALTNRWALSDDTSVNYLWAARKI